jgi:transposase
MFLVRKDLALQESQEYPAAFQVYQGHRIKGRMIWVQALLLIRLGAPTPTPTPSAASSTIPMSLGLSRISSWGATWKFDKGKKRAEWYNAVISKLQESRETPSRPLQNQGDLRSRR